MRSTLIIALVLASIGHVFGNFAELMKQGDVYDAKYEPDAALQYYLPAEKLEPENAVLLVKIARQYVFRMTDLAAKSEKIASGRKALAYAERAVKAAPGQCDPHLSVAICLGKLTPLMSNKESVEASRRIKTAAEKATKADPRNDYAWHMLGRWHQELAQIGGVTRAVALIVYGGLPAASNEEAVRCFEKSIALRPDRLIHHVELGRTYAAMGRKEDALKHLRKGLAMPDTEKDDPETKQRGRAALEQMG